MSLFDAKTARSRSEPRTRWALGPAFKPFKIVGYALALCILAVSISEFIQNAQSPSDRDFISFWAAAKLAMAGNAAGAYDNATLHALQSSAATFHGGGLPFPYPPAFLLLVLPFALLPFAGAMAAWSCLTFPFYLAAVRRMFPDSGWLAAAFPPVFVTAVIGQNSFVMASIFIGGLVLLQGRPFAAGLLLGCLILKPQLALLLPVAMLAGREWRTIIGAAVSSIGLMLVGAAVFGLAATLAWIDQMPLYVSIARDGLVGWNKLASIYAAGRQAGLDANLAMALHAIVASFAAFAVWKVWRSSAEPGAKAAMLAAATMVVSPYLFLYDALILVIPLLWLARRRVQPALLAMLWCLPLVTIAQISGLHGPVNLNPIVPVVLLLLMSHRLWLGQSRLNATAGAKPVPEQPALA